MLVLYIVINVLRIVLPKPAFGGISVVLLRGLRYTQLMRLEREKHRRITLMARLDYAQWLSIQESRL